MEIMLDTNKLRVEAQCGGSGNNAELMISWTVKPPPGRSRGSQYTTILSCDNDAEHMGQSDLFGVYKWLEKIVTMILREGLREEGEDLDADDEASYHYYFENRQKRIKETVRWEFLGEPDRDGELMVRVTYTAERSRRYHTAWSTLSKTECRIDIPRKDLVEMADKLRDALLDCCSGLKSYVENL